MKMMWMIVFLALPIAGIAYVSWHIWTLLPLATGWKWLAVGVLIVSVLMLFLDIGGLLDGIPLPLARVCYEIGTSSIIVLLYLVLTFLLLDLGRLVRLVPHSWLHGNGVTAVAIAGMMITLFVCANMNYYRKVRVPLDIVSTKPLPHDYRIVMLSDLHLGYHNPRKELARWVDMINGERPDLILIAGDIIDISVSPLIEENMAEEFRRFSAPVYACLGNHEYYSGTPKARQFYEDAGIHLLSDSSAVVDSALVIIGRDDRSNFRRKSIAELTSTLNPPLQLCWLATKGTQELSTLNSPFTILLDHQPYELELTEQAGIDFQLSGHTHRGQVWPISWITDAIYECSWGSHQRGNTRYYVSSGIGIWGGKFRIGTQSEYVVATLRAPSNL
ncbi:MAG: metallophosphoesterase [Prevotella sp.]|nr:metallophosphoesterase [Prevotella sp.]